MRKKYLGVIPARGGSKGVPKKNIKDMNGKPLIAYTIEAALKSMEDGVLDRLVVSTDSEEQESSYEAQCQHFTNLIAENPNWILADIYADEGITGTSRKKRDQFNRMMKDCEDGKIDMVITKSISRWARNTIDSLQSIRALKDLGIPVLFEKENINTMDTRGEVLITIMSSIAQQESDSISRNVRMGLQYQMQQGVGHMNTSWFLGYTRERKDGPLVIIPEEAELVRRIYRDFLNGFSPYIIAAQLEKEGIRTPSGRNNWYHSTVSDAEVLCGGFSDAQAGEKQRSAAAVLRGKCPRTHRSQGSVLSGAGRDCAKKRNQE